ncbi:hypothetical protein JMJ77_0002528 [Colletotrichum scovillei]|uniref:Uncharacterized protein n=1 Tax=Colletotrichum scovillei TaxID=1209932 RepID=A0A9P7R855_9PEZI|nr:hypothetical protein JMJ77_0002528 [Colletotrichum scovillei]KAG7070950.1 hypothetical protein JMJ76_0002191 [Colletotrichum scovillei]KAG7079199.1 hypothetical protein JMJ78_0002856 [Colletotrichum scovillei]
MDHVKSTAGHVAAVDVASLRLRLQPRSSLRLSVGAWLMFWGQSHGCRSSPVWEKVDGAMATCCCWPAALGAAAAATGGKGTIWPYSGT